MNYTVRDEIRQPPRLRRLAAPDAVLLRSARAPAVPRRGAPALPGAVSRVAPDRAGPATPDGAARRHAPPRRTVSPAVVPCVALAGAGPATPDGAARRHARLRRVQRDRARGSARVAR